jgi:hypothetical protein
MRKINNHFRGKLENISQLNREILKDHNMYLVELGNTRILTDYAQKSPGTLLLNCKEFDQ